MKSIASLALITTTIVGGAELARAEIDLITLASNDDVTWYLLVNKDPMSGAEEREVMAVEDNSYEANQYLYLECYKGKIYGRYSWEFGYPEGGRVEVMKIGNKMLEGFVDDSYSHSFDPNTLANLSGTVHFGYWDYNDKPHTVDSFPGFKGEFIRKLPGCEK